jgi:hypothetical protein
VVVIAHNYGAAERSDYFNTFTRTSVVTDNIARTKKISYAIGPAVIKDHIERI